MPFLQTFADFENTFHLHFACSVLILEDPKVLSAFFSPNILLHVYIFKLK